MQIKRWASTSVFLAVGLFAAAGITNCSAANPDEGRSEGESESDLAADQAALSAIPLLQWQNVCDGDPAPGFMKCHAKRVVDDGEMKPNATPNATPRGFGPSDLKSAYKIPTTYTGTIAIVDAYDNPTAESDLANYRSTYGLPPCTTANGCFKKVNQNGSTSSLPKADNGWAGEIALDVDMASATCPSCKILLVEANSASGNDLGTAVNTAAKLGANAISNSYGGGEGSYANQQDANYYNHPGIAITASTGDDGTGASYPATGKYVIAVGGTSLAKSTSSRGWAEGAWSKGGSGCSSYVSKPSYQKDTGCSKRAEADVAAVGDPSTGVAVYNTTGGSGWGIYGGTSASAPIVAGILVASGRASSVNVNGNGAADLYARSSAFNDVTSGSNGTCSSTAPYICKAGTGFDGPTGLGTPNGTSLVSGGTTPVDAGAPKDSGTTPVDAGAPKDSGTTPVDAGAPKDSGTTPPVDAGAPKDSGTTPPVDAGSGGPDNGTCTHDLCSTGRAQKSTCSSCAAKVCQADFFCCMLTWDATCVRQVENLCNTSCD